MICILPICGKSLLAHLYPSHLVAVWRWNHEADDRCLPHVPGHCRVRLRHVRSSSINDRVPTCLSALYTFVVLSDAVREYTVCRHARAECREFLHAHDATASGLPLIAVLRFVLHSLRSVAVAPKTHRPCAES